MVDETVVERFFCGEPAVAVAVLHDLLDGLAGLSCGKRCQLLLHRVDQLGLGLNVACGATKAAVWLVQKDSGVGRCITLALGSGREQELTHRSAHSNANCYDIVWYVLHGVINSHASRDRTTRRVDVQVNVFGRVFGGKHKHLRANLVGIVVANIAAEPDDSIL